MALAEYMCKMSAHTNIFKFSCTSEPMYGTPASDMDTAIGIVLV